MINRNSQIPLYVQLADCLREQIRSGKIKEGEKLPSESEMINTYHLGRLTVRDALAILVNEGLIEKRHGKGTFCKTNITAPKYRIDLILKLSDISFTPYFLKSICGVLEANNVSIILSDTGNNSESICNALEKALNEGSDGVIFQPVSTEATASPALCEALNRLSAAHIPYIMLDTFYSNVPEAYVVMDDALAGGMAADYLIGLGHERLCMIERRGNIDSALRLKGFSSRCTFPPHVINDDEQLEASLKAMLENQSDITGIFLFDGIAKKCYDILKALNISIPKDVSVISIDDTVVAKTLSPALTSIIHPKEEMGKAAAKLILKLISGELPWPQKKVFAPALAVRQSCI